MGFVSEDYHSDMLKKNNINIKTKYIVGNDILERNSDNSVNDDIDNGVRLSKEYYVNGVLKHKEKSFDTRIEYTYIGKEEEDKAYKCINCGMEGKVRDFLDGCPYCGTNYNIEYSDKDLGSKYHYDRVLKSNTYRIVVGIIDYIVCVLICLGVIKLTSRTFNSYDIGKAFIYGLILAAVLYYLFYLIDAYVILGPIKKYKDRLNRKQREFWKNSGLDKKEFYNNLNYEIGKYYYAKTNVIDYDILDYTDFTSFKHNDKFYIRVEAEIRVVYFINDKIVVKLVKDKYTMVQNTNDVFEVKGGVNLIKCHNCGATIDVNKGHCEYCNAQIKHLQKWILER